MLVRRGDKPALKQKHLSVSKPLIINFFIAVTLLFLISLLPSTIEPPRISSLFKNREIFSHLDEAKKISYIIKLRENLDRDNIHRIYFQVEVLTEVDEKSLMAVAQRVVKETISREDCGALRIDFGRYGYVDFAPYGEWERAAAALPGLYERYRFKYVLNPFLSLNKK